MPRSKIRSKKYMPRSVKLPSLVNSLPVSEVMVARFGDMQKRLLRLRLSGINGKNLASLFFLKA